MELVSLRCNRDFTSASSYGLGWYKYAIATQWYQFHTTDAWWFSLSIILKRHLYTDTRCSKFNCALNLNHLPLPLLTDRDAIKTDVYSVARNNGHFVISLLLVVAKWKCRRIHFSPTIQSVNFSNKGIATDLIVVWCSWQRNKTCIKVSQNQESNHCWQYRYHFCCNWYRAHRPQISNSNSQYVYYHPQHLDTPHIILHIDHLTPMPQIYIYIYI